MLQQTMLTRQQTEAIDFIYEGEYSLLQCTMGFGKTIVTLTAIQELLDEKHVKRVVVVAPLKVANMVWQQEAENWAHITDPVATCTGNPKQRLNVLQSDAKIVVINFENLPWFLKQKEADEFDGLVIDELTKLKNVGGAWFKSLRSKAKNFTWRVGLTGTLAEEGLDKLYGMCLVLDLGKALGRSKDRFLRKYFHATDYMQYNWEPNHDAFKQITQAISHFTFTADATDQKLPRKVICYLYGELPQKARSAYADMCKDMVYEDVNAANQAVKSMKLQQVCSGFMYRENAKHLELHDAKLSLIVGECERLLDEGKTIMIVYQFQWEVKRLLEKYPKAGVIGGSAKKHEVEETVAAWNDGRLNMMLVHPKSAGHGCNFQAGGANIIFTGPIWSRDQNDQIIARLHRRGQEAPVVEVTYCLMRDTIEDCLIVPRVEGKGVSASKFIEHLKSHAV